MLDGRQATIWTAIPGVVTSVDFSANTVQVQPSIQGSIEDENGQIQFVNLPLLVDVPILFPSAGGFTITFPIAVGDECLVVFSSRCIDAWWQSGGIQKPMEARMHDLSDGFAFLGPKSQPKKLSGISSSNLQIRTNNDNAHIEITPLGAVNIKTASTVTINGDLNVTGTINGAAVTSAGIGLSTHKHPQTGGPNTNGPIP